VRRRDEKSVANGARHRRDPLVQQRVERRRQRCVRIVEQPPVTRQLEREEGVAPAALRQPKKRRAVDLDPEPIAHDPRDLVRPERCDRQAVRLGESHPALAAETFCGQKHDLPGDQSPDRVAERCGRCVIDPLRVIDRDDEGVVLRERPERGQRGRGNVARLR
jgi:hypothetical protein